MNGLTVFLQVLNTLILVYGITLGLSYLILAVISIFETRHYLRKNSFIEFSSILGSPMAPSVSILAPAYNESATIVENVKSLLTINYPNFEVIVINDGSKDTSLAKLIQAYQLKPVSYAFQERIPTKRVNQIYKSARPEYPNLIVVDKENGGKGDALNAGLNISKSRLVASIDVDCILEEDALLKMVKPFMEGTNEQVIAAGGVIRIANSCEVVSGRIRKINLPDGLLPRIQVLEYIRSFLLSRMAWSRLNGILIISGAFGMFDREIALAAGGYSLKTVGEDMELVVKMRRHMQERKKPYRVVYIPDPLCWTEAPSSYKILFRQRNRWARGNAETLWAHRKLTLNPSYGRLGMLSYPFWVAFEWFAPIVEILGIFYFFVLAVLGMVSWPFFLLLLGVVYTFAVLFSMFAIYFEEKAYHQYKGRRELLRLTLTALIEPFIYHPFIMWSGVRGNFDLIVRRKKDWGNMQHKGFAQPKIALSAVIA